MSYTPAQPILLADALPAPTAEMDSVASYGLEFNGFTWDQRRATSVGIQGMALAAHTTQQMITVPNQGWVGLVAFFRVTVAGSGNLSVELLIADPPSGGYYQINAPYLVTTTGMYIFAWHPGAAVSGVPNIVQALSMYIARTWRIQITPSGGTSWTYSLGYYQVK